MSVSLTWGRSPIDVMDLRHVEIFPEQGAALTRLVELTAEGLKNGGYYIQIHDEDDNLIVESKPARNRHRTTEGDGA